MAKVQLIYIGTQQPQGIYEVDEKEVEGLLARKDFILVNKVNKKKHNGDILNHGIE